MKNFRAVDMPGVTSAPPPEPIKEPAPKTSVAKKPAVKKAAPKVAPTPVEADKADD